ncbi:Tol-Pal system beta propeller repeat protein TolB [Rhodovulum sp. DZ06]|uniref:Tol-Pal system beta propeller repeat protein TolB n=1 Tax=Rhodovulum sp. DZ06 TaxID=3425126 RepID=UPI003D334AFD
MGFARRAAAALVLAAALAAPAAPALAQDAAPGPLRIEITQGVVEPMPIALPAFAATPEAQALAEEIRGVVKADLESAGLFRVIDQQAYLSAPAGVAAVPAFENWRVINADALGVGQASLTPDGRLETRFKLWDVVSGRESGSGVGLRAAPADARRVGHKIADAIHLALTGEPGWFDTQVAFVDETGPKGRRVKRIAVMDQDGANVRYLTGPQDLVLTPRYSPDGRSLVYLSYQGGVPRVWIMDIATGQHEALGTFGNMSFAPRFSPDGARVALSLTEGGNTDLYEMRLSDRRLRRLSAGPGIETAPSYSPDGRWIVYESDAGGSQQLYVMPAGGGVGRRISFGDGRYGTPVWSPRGDLIAFTKQLGGRFHVGVMSTDGTGERLLTASFLDEAPTWAPNGRALMFFRETPGPNGAPALWRVDATGRVLKRVDTPAAASDPSWSPPRP